MYNSNYIRCTIFISKKEKEDYITLELSVYGEEKDKYENYEISSYLKNAKINKKGPDFIGIVEKINGKAVIVTIPFAIITFISTHPLWDVFILSLHINYSIFDNFMQLIFLN